MRKALYAALLFLAASATPAFAWVSVSIGLNVPVYPQLVAVPGVPVYYAPNLPANYFFYDGMYWTFEGDRWYSSSWYNGPWAAVEPAAVPVFLWRVPVSYYRAPPAYFSGWVAGEPPRWGYHWGPEWVGAHRDWDHWDRAAYRPVYAPLPAYQARYSGNMYPKMEAQAQIHAANYHYAPKDAVVRQRYEEHGIAREQARINKEQGSINRQQANINREQSNINKEQHVVNKEQQNVNRQQANVSKEQHTVNKEQHAVNTQQKTVNTQQKTVTQQQHNVTQQQHTVAKEQQHVNKEEQHH